MNVWVERAGRLSVSLALLCLLAHCADSDGDDADSGTPSMTWPPVDGEDPVKQLRSIARECDPTRTGSAEGSDYDDCVRRVYAETYIGSCWRVEGWTIERDSESGERECRAAYIDLDAYPVACVDHDGHGEEILARGVGCFYLEGLDPNGYFWSPFPELVEAALADASSQGGGRAMHRCSAERATALEALPLCADL